MLFLVYGDIFHFLSLEPLMNIQTDQKSTRYEELPRPAIVMDVYCSANNVADNPQITLQIKDHSHGDMLISNKTTIMKDPFGYNRVLYRAVIPAVVIGDVICLLTDSLGTFIEKQLLKAAGRALLTVSIPLRQFIQNYYYMFRYKLKRIIKLDKFFKCIILFDFQSNFNKVI